MTTMIIRFLIMSGLVYLVALLLPGMRLRGFKAALSVSLVYGLLNFLFFRVLLFITFPLVALKYLTLGLFGILLNAVLLVITDKVLDDFEMSGFGTALLAAAILSVANLALSPLLAALL
ncbi:MAG: phage holin family protein [Deltaproteobacteria bacterium]|nr:phage holin family protein [Deltaproteobacteria bacterium]